MPNWSSPEELQLDDGVLVKFIHALMGVYVLVLYNDLLLAEVPTLFFSSWEWFLTIDFDWDVITRKKAFRWPIVS